MGTLFEVEQEVGTELPELVGTPKQVPWAKATRKELLAKAESAVRERQRFIAQLLTAGRIADAEPHRKWLRRALDRLEQMQAETRAGWWISRRDNTAVELLSGAKARPGAFGEEGRDW